jgi:iron complex transport system ATP-binding protein
MTLSIEKINVFYGKARVLKDVSTKFETGQFHALIGPNGSGKSTFLKSIAGLLPLQSGQIKGLDAQTSKAKQLSYLSQNRTAHPQMLAKDIVALGREPHRRPFLGLSNLDKTAINNAILQTDITRLKDKTFGTLSGGQQARVLLARAIAVEAPILVVDEPVAALDPYYQLSILECLKAETRKGRIVIAALHNLSLARQFADTIHVLSGGKLVQSGPPDLCLSETIMRDVFRIKYEKGRQTPFD